MIREYSHFPITNQLTPHKQNLNSSINKQSLNSSNLKEEWSCSNYRCQACQSNEQQKHNLVLLMREQIEIVTKKYKLKFEEVIKQQSIEINRLSKLVRENANHKYSESQTPKIRLTHLQRSKSRKAIQIVSPDIRHSNKLDFHNRVTFLEEKLEHHQAIIAQLTQDSQNFRSMTKVYCSGLAQMHKVVTEIELVIGQDKAIQQSIKTAQCLKEQINVIESNCKRLKANIEELKTNIAQLSNKQLTYDHYYLSDMKKQIDKLHKVVNDLQQHKASPKPIQMHSDNLISNPEKNIDCKSVGTQYANFKSSSTASNNTSSHSNDLLPEPKGPSVNIKNEDSCGKHQWRINNQEQPEYFEASLDDNDNEANEAEDDSYESLLWEDEQKTQTVCRFISTIANKVLPLKVEIDQTGYLKDHHSGMYFVDAEGDGFQFDEAELQLLISEGFIKL